MAHRAQVFFFKVLGGHGTIEVVALAVAAAGLGEGGNLGPVLYPLRHADHAVGMAYAHQVPHQHLSLGIVGQLGDQAAVQLHRIKFHVGENGDVGVFRSKIVQGKANPKDPKALQGVIQGLPIHADPTLRYLHFQHMGRDHGVTALYGQHRCGSGRVEQGAPGKIYRQGHQRQPACSPPFHQGQGVIQHEQVQIPDGAVFLHLLDKVVGGDQLARGVHPPHQRFRAQQPAGGHVYFGLKVEQEPAQLDGLIRGDVLSVQDVFGGFYSFAAHDGAGLVHQIPAGEHPFRPAVTDAQPAGIAALQHGAQPGTPPQEHLPGGVRAQGHEFGVPSAKEEGAAEDVGQRLGHVPQQLAAVLKAQVAVDGGQTRNVQAHRPQGAIYLGVEGIDDVHIGAQVGHIA